MWCSQVNKTLIQLNVQGNVAGCDYMRRQGLRKCMHPGACPEAGAAVGGLLGAAIRGMESPFHKLHIETTGWKKAIAVLSHPRY